jgi:hypothetical protein
MWYHGFRDMFPYIMAPEQWYGAGWGPNLRAPAARRFTFSGLAIANVFVLGSEWGLSFI